MIVRSYSIRLFVSQPPVQGAIALTLHRWPWGWGVTGSTGYALATEIPVLHAASDLDLLIRAPQPLDREALLEWQTRVAQLPCRADTQIETPYGAFALNEWLRDGRALLKTSRGSGALNRDAVAQGGIMKILFTFPGQGRPASRHAGDDPRSRGDPHPGARRAGG